MFALSRGELAIVVFIFALVWSAGALPRAAADFAAWWSRRAAARKREGVHPSSEGR